MFQSLWALLSWFCGPYSLCIFNPFSPQYFLHIFLRYPQNLPNVWLWDPSSNWGSLSGDYWGRYWSMSNIKNHFIDFLFFFFLFFANHVCFFSRWFCRILFFGIALPTKQSFCFVCFWSILASECSVCLQFHWFLELWRHSGFCLVCLDFMCSVFDLLIALCLLILFKYLFLHSCPWLLLDTRFLST